MEGGAARLRAVGYIRVSQVGDRSGDSFLSPGLQRERIESWASYREHEVVRWYTDLDVSGREGVRRPEFERMMSDARRKVFDVVAVYRLTRFGRSVKDAADRYSELRKLGIGLVSVTEDLDTTTAGGRFMQNMLFAMAELESERIGEEWRSVHANRRSRGLVWVPRGLYGYRVEKAVPVAVEAADARAVREVYQRRAGGASIGQLRDWLHDEGYKPPRGGTHFAAPTLRSMLRNPAYAGLVQAGGELVEATHEPIVSRELWEQVQRLHVRTAKLSRYRSGLGSGLVKCAGCGYAMTAWHSTRSRTRYYRCAARLQARECPAPTVISMPKLDAYLEAAFLRRARRLALPRGGKVTRGASRWQRQESVLTARVDELRRALDSLADARFRGGSVGHAEYERQAERLLADRARAEGELEEARALAAQERPRTFEFFDAWPTFPLERRQLMLRRLVREVTVRPGKRGGPQPPISMRVAVEWVA